MNYWQMTLEEALEPEKPQEPEGRYELVRGMWMYYCPICGDLVGTYSDGSVHRERGFIMHRDRCRHGHIIDWREQ